MSSYPIQHTFTVTPKARFTPLELITYKHQVYVLILQQEENETLLGVFPQTSERVSSKVNPQQMYVDVDTQTMQAIFSTGDDKPKWFAIGCGNMGETVVFSIRVFTWPKELLNQPDDSNLRSTYPKKIIWTRENWDKMGGQFVFRGQYYQSRICKSQLFVQRLGTDARTKNCKNSNPPQHDIYVDIFTQDSLLHTTRLTFHQKDPIGLYKHVCHIDDVVEYITFTVAVRSQFKAFDFGKIQIETPICLGSEPWSFSQSIDIHPYTLKLTSKAESPFQHSLRIDTVMINNIFVLMLINDDKFWNWSLHKSSCQQSFKDIVLDVPTKCSLNLQIVLFYKK